MPWSNLIEMKGFRGPVAKAFEVMGVPTVVLVDRNGIILATRAQEGNKAIEAIIRSRLSASPTTQPTTSQ